MDGQEHQCSRTVGSDANGVEDDLTEHPLSPLCIMTHSTTAHIASGHQYMPWMHMCAVVAARHVEHRRRLCHHVVGSNHTPHWMDTLQVSNPCGVSHGGEAP